MSDTDLLDRILSSDDPLIPSSGFMARVMEAVKDADAEVPLLPFPWRRFILGVTTILVSVASGLWLVARLDSSALLTEVDRVWPEVARVWPELACATVTFLLTLALMYAPRLRGIAHRLLSPNV